MPHSNDFQNLEFFALETKPHSQLHQFDLPSGRVHHFNVLKPHYTLRFVSEAIVCTNLRNPCSGLDMLDDGTVYYEEFRDDYIEYLVPTPRTPFLPEVRPLLSEVKKVKGAVSMLNALMATVHGLLTYTPGATHVDSDLMDIWNTKQGVCQDYAHLMLSMCRQAGIPSRYVSGYLYTGSQIADHDPLISNDAMHAWVECLIPGGIWRGFDPTNNLMVDDHYVKVHHGREYADVAPVRGIYRGTSAVELEVSVQVLAL